MKLHLPKLLFVAVVAACCANLTLAQDVPVSGEDAIMPIAVDSNPDAKLIVSGSEGCKIYNVGLYDKVNDKKAFGVEYISSSVLLSDAKNTATVEGDLTLSGSDKLGAFDANGNLITSFGRYTLSGYSAFGLSGHFNGTKSTVTNNLKVTKTLTVSGNAQVVLGGQVATDQYAEYAGVIADAIVVAGDTKEDGTPVTTNLSTWNANVNSLTVNSGKVEIHTQIQYGNNFFNFGAPQDSKQAQFKRAININGGVTTINDHYNENNLDDASIFATFGEIVFKKGGKDGSVTDYTKADYAEVRGATITQTAGTLVVEGKTASVGGLNIVQQGGTMSISSDGLNQHSWHILSDYGDSKIEQSGKAGTVLNIGGIGAFNSKYSAVVDKLAEYGASYDDATGELVSGSEKVDVRPVLELIQSGAGEINIFKGVDFSDHRKDNMEDSHIIQSGGGEINLGGEYKGVVFDIDQSGENSTLNVKGNLAADVVNQDSNGSIVVTGDKTLTANAVNAGVLTYEKQTVNGEEVNVVTGGSVEMEGNISLTNGTLSSNGDTVTNSGVLKADKIVVTSGTFVNNGSINAMAAPADAALIMLAGNGEDYAVVVEGGSFENFGTCGGSILVDGGTLTLTDASVNGGVVVDSGTVNVTSDSTLTSLTLNADAVLNVTEGAVVTLTNDDGLNIQEGATIMVTVSTEMLENLDNKEFTLFSGNVENLASANIVFTDGDADTSNDKQANISLGSTSGSIKVESTVSIPEPATATLSLLALAGLAMRRRRK